MIVSRSGQLHMEIDCDVYEGIRESFPYADCLIFRQGGREIKKVHTTDFSPKVDEISLLNDDFIMIGDTKLKFIVHYDDCTWLPQGEVTWDLYIYLPDEDMGVPFKSGTIEVL